MGGETRLPAASGEGEASDSLSYSIRPAAVRAGNGKWPTRRRGCKSGAADARMVYMTYIYRLPARFSSANASAMLPEYTREELAAGLDAVAMDLLAAAGMDGPPVDAFALARRLGITVAVDDGQQGRARYVRLDARRPARSRPTILLRSDPRGERRHWAIAHEIGEYAAYRVFAHWGVDVREVVPRAREEVANRLAGRLLLPTAGSWPTPRPPGWDLWR